MGNKSQFPLFFREADQGRGLNLNKSNLGVIKNSDAYLVSIPGRGCILRENAITSLLYISV